MKDWKSTLIQEVRGKHAERPVDFDEWLSKCISFRYIKGTLIIKGNQLMVLEEYYRNGKTLQQIADERGCTRQNIADSKGKLIRNLQRADKIIQSGIKSEDSVFSLEMTNRILCRMYENNIQTVRELDEKLKDGTLARTRNIGPKTLAVLMQLVTEWKKAHGNES